ncbi:uroporphyrinogen-III synthase [Parvibaculum sp.]|uniref:uroporphyrinogen-III synthase n=1 Tax=Parvibaculum sp. TaxID=2024848 RepID=UPI000C92CB86|nr:uroporphyrinogen-III synthase [Parvibaculum sp.]MAB14161.1 uroporphyrinogen III synthase [Parvibaculum sp.]
MRLLVTRPEADAGKLMAALAESGHEAVLAPLMEIDFHDTAELPAGEWQAILVTSANGARALAARSEAMAMKAVPVYAVGQASAAAARAAGFARVRSADGDVEALADLVCAELSPGAGRLLHVAGSVTAGDLQAMLGVKGFEVVRAVLYEARPVRFLPDVAHAALEARDVDGVLLYSPRTAGLFMSLVHEAGLDGALAGLEAFCLSGAVAGALADAPGRESGTAVFRRVHVAARPEQAALIELVNKTGLAARDDLT